MIMAKDLRGFENLAGLMSVCPEQNGGDELPKCCAMLFTGISPCNFPRSVNKIHVIPIGLKIPQGNKDEKVMKVEGEPEFAEFNLCPEPVSGIFFQFSQRDNFQMADLVHQLAGLFEGMCHPTGILFP